MISTYRSHWVKSLSNLLTVPHSGGSDTISAVRIKYFFCDTTGRKAMVLMVSDILRMIS